VLTRAISRTRLIQTEFAKLLPERLTSGDWTVIGFAATMNRTSCFAIRNAHFGFAAGSLHGCDQRKIAGARSLRAVSRVVMVQAELVASRTVSSPYSRDPPLVEIKKISCLKC